MRCSRHDLAPGPDGRCVLCRRNGARPVSRRDEGPPSLPPVIAPRSVFLTIALMFALGGAGAAWAVRSPSERSERSVAIGVASEPPRAQPASAADTAIPSAVEAASSPTDPATDPRLRALLAMSDPREGDHRTSAAQPSPWAGTPGSPDAPVAQQPVHVIVYTTSWCPSCRAAKSWLQKNGVAYEERDIEASRTYAAQMRALNPRGSIPTFDVEGDVNVGFSSSWLVATLRKHRSARAD